MGHYLYTRSLWEICTNLSARSIWETTLATCTKPVAPLHRWSPESCTCHLKQSFGPLVFKIHFAPKTFEVVWAYRSKKGHNTQVYAGKSRPLDDFGCAGPVAICDPPLLHKLSIDVKRTGHPGFQGERVCETKTSLSKWPRWSMMSSRNPYGTTIQTPCLTVVTLFGGKCKNNCIDLRWKVPYVNSENKRHCGAADLHRPACSTNSTMSTEIWAKGARKSRRQSPCITIHALVGRCWKNLKEKPLSAFSAPFFSKMHCSVLQLSGRN